MPASRLGGVLTAVEHSGAAAVLSAITDAAAPFRRADGSYRCEQVPLPDRPQLRGHDCHAGSGIVVVRVRPNHAVTQDKIGG